MLGWPHGVGPVMKQNTMGTVHGETVHLTFGMRKGGRERGLDPTVPS
jgi:hypothetical protein